MLEEFVKADFWWNLVGMGMISEVTSMARKGMVEDEMRERADAEVGDGPKRGMELGFGEVMAAMGAGRVWTVEGGCFSGQEGSF